MKVIAFGEILWDVIEGEEHLGGAPFNFAAHCAQSGNDSYIISRLGTDYLGMRAFNKCKTHGVGQQLIQWDEDHSTGTVDVKLSKGQPDYFIHENVAYDFIDQVQLSGKAPFVADVFYFGSLAQRHSVSAQCLAFVLANLQSTYRFYDVNLRKGGYSEEIIRRSLKACNVFKLNTDELPIISQLVMGNVMTNDQFVKALTNLFPNIKIIIITAADKGCYVFTATTGLVHIEGVPVTVADAVGAGDAFSAAFMHMLVRHGDPLIAARAANRVGGFVASHRGPIPEYNTEVTALLNGDLKVLTP